LVTIMYRMYFIVCLDAVKKMNGIRGKMMTQAGHGYLHSFWDAQARFPDDATGYTRVDHPRKITVQVDSEHDLNALYAAYRRVCGVSLVKDSGFTVFNEPTVTGLGIGPIKEDLIGDDLKGLKLFK